VLALRGATGDEDMNRTNHAIGRVCDPCVPNRLRPPQLRTAPTHTRSAPHVSALPPVADWNSEQSAGCEGQ
jgi:hypothetical protein